MTVRYTGEFATNNNSSLGCFTKLLFRWCGSVYKLIWREYLLFITLYFIISLVYRFGLTEPQAELFERIVSFCKKSNSSLEMSFVLGFFVTSIVKKWWKLFYTIPWPDTLAVFIDASIPGQDEYTKQLRRTIMRYCNLNLILTFCAISPPLRTKYPSLQNLVKDGLLTEEEKLIMKRMTNETTHSLHWLPAVWASRLVVQAHKEGRLPNEVACQRIIDQIEKTRYRCNLLLEYEHSSVPLAYIQVVTISVYSYFLSSLIGSQWLKYSDEKQNLDLYFPIFTTLKFIFYMGWLKVAESLINPFGCDDDDFELDKFLARNIEVMDLMATGKNNHLKCQEQSVEKKEPHCYVNNGFLENEKHDAVISLEGDAVHTGDDHEEVLSRQESGVPVSIKIVADDACVTTTM